MDFSIRTLHLHPAANRWLAHLEKPMPAAAGRAAPRPCDRSLSVRDPVVGNCAGLRSSADRFRTGFGVTVEYALFAVTLAAIAYLYLGVVLAQAFRG